MSSFDQALKQGNTVNPMGGRQGLPGIAVEGAAAANGGLSTWGFQPTGQQYSCRVAPLRIRIS